MNKSAEPMLPIEIKKEEFLKIGHQLIDSIASFIETIETKKVTKGETPRQIQHLLGLLRYRNTGTPNTGASLPRLPLVHPKVLQDKNKNHNPCILKN
jgi:hypothetical protein